MQELFVLLNVINGRQKIFKALTLAGYTGFLTVFHNNPAVLSVEYNAKIPELTLMQVIVRHFRFQWTPGQILRYCVEENINTYERAKIVHRLRNNIASVPYRFNIMDSENIIKVHPPIMNRFHGHTPLIQTFGDTVDPVMSIRDCSYDLVKYVRYDDIEELKSLFVDFFIYAKIKDNELILNGMDFETIKD